MSEPGNRRAEPEASAVAQTNGLRSARAMDEDVAAILGLTALDMERRAAASGWARPAFALGGAAALICALVVSVLVFTQVRTLPAAPRSQGAPSAAVFINPPMAMSARAPKRAETAPRDAEASAGQARRNRGAETAAALASDRAARTPAAKRVVAALNDTASERATASRGEAPPDAPSAAEDVRDAATAPTPDQKLQADIVAARLEAVDALRALRQK